MFVLVTPAKDEEENLPTVIQSVINQQRIPDLWVIVDDGSSDSTADIANEFSTEYEWIQTVEINRNKNEYNSELGYAKVVSNGIQYIYDIVEIPNEIELIGLLDADIILEGNYFSNLIKICEEDSDIGIISGLLHTDKSRDTPDGMPRGAGRIYRKEALGEIGGYPITPAPDTVTNVKIKLNDWKLVKTQEAEGHQIRPPRSAISKWKGHFDKGQSMYYLNYHPVCALLTGIYISTSPPFYDGFAYLLGFFRKYSQRDKKIQDEQVSNYFYNKVYQIPRSTLEIVMKYKNSE